MNLDLWPREKAIKATHGKSIPLFCSKNIFCSFQNDSPPTTTRTTTKLLLGPLRFARGQKALHPQANMCKETLRVIVHSNAKKDGNVSKRCFKIPWNKIKKNFYRDLFCNTLFERLENKMLEEREGDVPFQKLLVCPLGPWKL